MKFSFVATSVGSIVNIILNYLLIPLYGPKGAAFATLVAYMMAAYICGFFYVKTFRITIFITRSLCLRSFIKLVLNK